MVAAQRGHAVTNVAGGDFRGFLERDRPFIDDEPARKHGWEAPSRWGSRPFREFGRALGFFHWAWTRVKTAVRDHG